MNFSLRHFARLLVMTLTLPLGVAATLAQAGDFAYETAIYGEDSTKVLETHSSYFVGDAVYDWQARRALIVDFDTQKITILDAARQLQTSMDFNEMEWRLAKSKLALRNAVTATRDGNQREMLAFFQNPSYDIAGDNDSRVVTFDDRHVKYVVSVLKPEADALQKVSRFLDVTTRLSCVDNPAGLARIPVNDWLNGHGMVPMRIERTIKESQAPGARSATIRSQHEIRPELTTKDKTRIDEVQFWQKDFRVVDYDTFIKP